MDYIALIQLAVQYAPIVKQIIDEATSNDEIVQKVETLAAPVGAMISNLGSQLFPKSSAALQTVGAAIAAFDPNTTKWLQKSLNTMLTPSPNLTVDGIYGAKTQAAVVQLQSKLGLTPDGIAGKLTQAAIQAAIGATTNKPIGG